MKPNTTFWSVVKDYKNITKSSIDEYPVDVYGVISDYTIYKTYDEALETLREIYNRFYKDETDAIWYEERGCFILELTNIFHEKVEIKYHISPLYINI